MHNNIGNINSSLTVKQRTTYAIINSYNIENMLTNYIIKTPQVINIEEGLSKLNECFSKEIPPSYILRSYLKYIGDKILNKSVPPDYTKLEKFSKNLKKLGKNPNNILEKFDNEILTEFTKISTNLNYIYNTYLESIDINKWILTYSKSQKFSKVFSDFKTFINQTNFNNVKVFSKKESSIDLPKFWKEFLDYLHSVQMIFNMLFTYVELSKYSSINMDNELVASSIVKNIYNNRFYKIKEERDWLCTIMYSFFIDMVDTKNFGKKIDKDKIEVLNYFENFGFYVEDILKK